MFKDKKVIVFMPAYNVAKTLRKTYHEVMAQEVVDLVIIVDDASSDETAAVANAARWLAITSNEHQKRDLRVLS
jgi:glycosyltransferase involved in cell wall biosynthesis